MSDFEVKGEVGATLEISVAETLVPFQRPDRDAFHAGGWRQLLEGRERHNPEKYHLQAGPPHRYHFAELNTFSRLMNDG
jgi:hypothetical protein